VDSKDIAFQIAGYFAFKESFMAARPCLLEPINTVEIRIPDDCMGKVMGDLSSRRGKIQGMDVDGGFQLIKAHVPAKELYRYSSTLRSLTGGRGVHGEEFSHYEEMPREQEQKVVEEYKSTGNSNRRNKAASLHQAPSEIIAQRQIEHDKEPDKAGRHKYPGQSRAGTHVHEKQNHQQHFYDGDCQRSHNIQPPRSNGQFPRSETTRPSAQPKCPDKVSLCLRSWP